MEATESEPLRVIEPLINRSFGVISEGDVFSVLKHSPFVVRSFEFALADGAVDCTAKYDTAMGWADRLWNVDQRQRQPRSASTLALIDVKSSLQALQQYIATVGQTRRVAVFICTCAGDPSFVDVIPNMRQDADAMTDTIELAESEQRDISIMNAKVSRLPSSAYGSINPSACPYRMPLRLLPEAITRIRSHVQGKATYINPWSCVSFPQWRPLTVHGTEWLKPSEPAHRSAYEAALKIYQTLTFGNSGTFMRADTVGLQPRLGDFKLIWNGKQYIQQHKLDHQLRKRGTPLTHVRIARGEGPKRIWYFSAHERFDYFYYHMEFSQLPNPRPRVEFFFLPEKVVPDEFFTTTDVEANFEIPNFNICALPDKEGRVGFRIHMDEDGQWVHHIWDVIRAYPQPRKQTERPSRILDAVPPSAETHESTLCLRASTKGKPGKREYAEAMRTGHRRYFYKIMARCARRRLGLLIVLARDHPLGDFGYCGGYVWTDAEQKAFLEYYRPPHVLHTLPPKVELVPICYYTRHGECSYQGPCVTAAEFRRLNSSHEGRLLIWDLAGADAVDLPVVIPSEDLQPSAAQRAVFRNNLGLRLHQRKTNTPALSALLATGLQAGEYAVGNEGPLTLSTCRWDAMWTLLHAFATQDSVQHPSRYSRRATLYRHSVQVFNQTLQNEHLLSGPQLIAVEDNNDGDDGGEE